MMGKASPSEEATFRICLYENEPEKKLTQHSALAAGFFHASQTFFLIPNRNKEANISSLQECSKCERHLMFGLFVRCMHLLALLFIIMNAQYNTMSALNCWRS